MAKMFNYERGGSTIELKVRFTSHSMFNKHATSDTPSLIFDEFFEFLYSPYESFHTVTYFAAYSDDAPTYSVDTCFRHISRTLLRRRVGIQYDIRVLSVSSRLSYLTPTGRILWKYLHYEFTHSIFFPNCR